jgi:hypothetical protein
MTIKFFLPRPSENMVLPLQLLTPLMGKVSLFCRIMRQSNCRTVAVWDNKVSLH